MKILALDSSGAVASAAIMDDGKILAEYTVNYKKTHSQTLLPMIKAVVDMTETVLADVDVFAAASGPGSFTGLRIGSATVKGLTLALDKDVVPVPTLEGLAYNFCGSENLICPVMDARHSEVYRALYRFEGEKISEVWKSAPENIEDMAEKLDSLGKKIIFTGDGVDVYSNLLEERLGSRAFFAPPNRRYQSAASVAMAASVRAGEGRFVSSDLFAPEYLKLSQAERERNRKITDSSRG